MKLINFSLGGNTSTTLQHPCTLTCEHILILYIYEDQNVGYDYSIKRSPTSFYVCMFLYIYEYNARSTLEPIERDTFKIRRMCGWFYSNLIGRKLDISNKYVCVMKFNTWKFWSLYRLHFCAVCGFFPTKYKSLRSII